MIDVTSIANGFDFHALYGVAGVPLLESIINYLKDQWRLPAKLAPIAALIVGVLINVWSGYVLHVDLLSSIYTGLFVGFGSSVWYEMTKPQPTPIIQNQFVNKNDVSK